MGAAMTKDIASYFTFEKAPRRLADIETPVPVIDLAVVERNLRRWQARCDGLGIANRPHIKTHKQVALAKFQLDLGARGITVQKLGEAEVMAAAGITDMLLTFDVVGKAKLARLAALARTTAIAVVADSAEVVAGLGTAGVAAGRDIRVLVECDTGAGRNGVQTPEAAVALAKVIDATPGVLYGGLMTYPKSGTRSAAASFLEQAVAGAAAAGLASATVSSGGSPDMWSDAGLGPITEYRVGTNIFFDRSSIALGVCREEDCALTVVATVVSRPTAVRAMIDAGSKSLTSDPNGLEGYGLIRNLAGAAIYNLSEEHGFVDVSAAAAKPAIGDQLRIIPNHVCPVVNLFDRVIIARGDDVLGYGRVDARGHVA
jgi:D-serine deaminase-like pyridoxal phosphate-dependent protein